MRNRLEEPGDRRAGSREDRRHHKDQWLRGCPPVPVATFLQISDLHLGAPFRWLPPAAREQRRRDQRLTLEAAVRAAIEHRAQAILIPGDLFDGESVDAETMAFALHAFDTAGCPPVYIAPGNHDPWSDTNACWSPRLLRARGWAWPEHVRVFSTPDWTGVAVPGASIQVWGRTYADGTPASTRPLGADGLPPSERMDPAMTHVALLHGSREGACPAWQVETGPFSDDEVRAAPFAYVAAGHYHMHSRLEDAAAEGDPRPPRVRLAYAGSAVALDVLELGEHGALLVRVEQEAGGTTATTEFLKLDPRRVHAVEADVSGASSADEVDRRVLATLDAAQASQQDIVTARLFGRLHRGVRYAAAGPLLQGRVFHLRTDVRGVRPDYDLDAYREGSPLTTEERFARLLLERLDAETDPEARARIERALYYGLDAIKLGEVNPSYEEMGT